MLHVVLHIRVIISTPHCLSFWSVCGIASFGIKVRFDLACPVIINMGFNN